MRLVFVLAILVAISPVILAQNESSNNTTTNETPVNDTPVNDTPEPAGPIVFELKGQGGGGAFYWTVEGVAGNNPTLSVPPGADVTFVFTTETGSVHNLKVGDSPVSKALSEGDPAIEYKWKAPDAAGSVVYICVIHGKAMSGTIQVGAAPPPSGGGDGGEIVGETIDLGALGYPQCAGVMIPAIVTTDVVGAPTVQDYVDRCQSGGQGVSTTRPSHPVDYVIPGSMVAIGLGIVGVVWVHRYYKP